MSEATIPTPAPAIELAPAAEPAAAEVPAPAPIAPVAETPVAAPAPIVIDAASLAAFDKSFRQVADWTNTAYLTLLQYTGQNTDFRQHFVIYPSVNIKSGAIAGVGSDTGINPAAIQTPDDLKQALRDCIIASPNVPDNLLEPGVRAIRDRAIEHAIDVVKANVAKQHPANDTQWTSKVAANPAAIAR